MHFLPASWANFHKVSSEQRLQIWEEEKKKCQRFLSIHYLATENGVGLSRDVVCYMSLLIILEVTGQLLSWFGWIWGVLVEEWGGLVFLWVFVCLGGVVWLFGCLVWVGFFFSLFVGWLWGFGFFSAKISEIWEIIQWQETVQMNAPEIGLLLKTKKTILIRFWVSFAVKLFSSSSLIGTVIFSKAIIVACYQEAISRQ